MLKSELMDLLHEIEGDPVVYLEFYDTLRVLGNVYVDDSGDIILEP